MTLDIMFIIFIVWLGLICLYWFTILAVNLQISKKISSIFLISLVITFPKNVFKNLHKGKRYSDWIFTDYNEKISFLQRKFYFVFLLTIFYLISTLLFALPFVILNINSDDFAPTVAKDIRSLWIVVVPILAVLFLIYIFYAVSGLLVKCFKAKHIVQIAQSLNNDLQASAIEDESINSVNFELKDYFFDKQFNMTFEINNHILRYFYGETIKLDSQEITELAMGEDFEEYQNNLY